MRPTSPPSLPTKIKKQGQRKKNEKSILYHKHQMYQMNISISEQYIISIKVPRSLAAIYNKKIEFSTSQKKTCKTLHLPKKTPSKIKAIIQLFFREASAFFQQKKTAEKEVSSRKFDEAAITVIIISIMSVDRDLFLMASLQQHFVGRCVHHSLYLVC